MAKLVKHTERDCVNYLIDLEHKYAAYDPNRKSADAPINYEPGFLDVSDILRDANRADRKSGYQPDNGPFFAHELQKIMTYVDYVVEHASPDNLYKFSVPRLGYRFFTDGQVSASSESREKRRVSQSNVSQQ